MGSPGRDDDDGVIDAIPSLVLSSSTAAFGGADPSRERGDEGPNPPRLLFEDVRPLGRIGLPTTVLREEEGEEDLGPKRQSSHVGLAVMGWRRGGLEGDGRRGVEQPGRREG